MMNRFGKNTLDKRQNLSKRKILFSIIFFPEMEAKIVFIVSGKFRGGWADSSEKLEGGGEGWHPWPTSELKRTKRMEIDIFTFSIVCLTWRRGKKPLSAGIERESLRRSHHFYSCTGTTLTLRTEGRTAELFLVVPARH